MSHKNKTNNKSLCEKSMKMIVNIIRLSSFSIAKMSLGTPNPVPTTRALSSSTNNVGGVDEPLLPQIPGGRRSQEPRGSSIPVKFVMQPTTGGEDNSTTSSYVVHDEEKKNVVDSWADDYIRKVHEKNRKNAKHDSSNLDLFIIPPPPRIVK